MEEIDFDTEYDQSNCLTNNDPIVMNAMDSEILFNQLCNSINVSEAQIFSNGNSNDTHQAKHSELSTNNVGHLVNENFSIMLESHAWEESKNLDKEIDFDTMCDTHGSNLCFGSELLDTSDISLPNSSDLMDILEEPQKVSQSFETFGNEINNKVIQNSTDVFASLLTVTESDLMETDLLWGDIVKDLDTQFLSDDFVNSDTFFDNESNDIFPDLSTDYDNSGMEASISNWKKSQVTSRNIVEIKNNAKNYGSECVIRVGTVNPLKSTESSPVTENSDSLLKISEVNDHFGNGNKMNLDIFGSEIPKYSNYVDNVHVAMYPQSPSPSHKTETAVISKTQVDLGYSFSAQANSKKDSSLSSKKTANTINKSKTIKKVGMTVETSECRLNRKCKARKINEILNIKRQKSPVKRKSSCIKNQKEQFFYASHTGDQLRSETVTQKTNEPVSNSKNTIEMKKIVKPQQSKQSKTASIKVDKNGCLISLPKSNVNTLMVKDLLLMSGKKKVPTIKDATEEYRRNILAIMQQKQLRLKRRS